MFEIVLTQTLKETCVAKLVQEKSANIRRVCILCTNGDKIAFHAGKLSGTERRLLFLPEGKGSTLEDACTHAEAFFHIHVLPNYGHYEKTLCVEDMQYTIYRFDVTKDWEWIQWSDELVSLTYAEYVSKSHDLPHIVTKFLLESLFPVEVMIRAQSPGSQPPTTSSWGDGSCVNGHCGPVGNVCVIDGCGKVFA